MASSMVFVVHLQSRPRRVSSQPPYVPGTMLPTFKRKSPKSRWQPPTPSAFCGGPPFKSLARPKFSRLCAERCYFYSISDRAGDTMAILTLPRWVCLSFSVEISTRIVSKMEMATFFFPLGTTTL